MKRSIIQAPLSAPALRLQATGALGQGKVDLGKARIRRQLRELSWPERRR